MSQNQTRSSTVVALAANQSPLESDGRVWVQIMPKGQIEARDGRRWSASNLKAIIAETVKRANGADLVVDFEHQTDFAENNGQPAPAAGWMKKLEARADGIYALVEWTSRAKAMLAGKEYRFLSPTFLSNKESGEVAIILRAALTNNPALVMKQLAKSEEGNNSMEELAAISAALGLEDGADLASVLKAIGELKSVAETPCKETASAHDGLIKDLAMERSQLYEQRLSEKVDMACRNGVITPAMKKWAINYCRDHEADFDDFCARMGKPFAYLLSGSEENKAHNARFEKLQTQLTSGKSISGNSNGSNVQSQIAKQLVLSIDDLK